MNGLYYDDIDIDECFDSLFKCPFPGVTDDPPRKACMCDGA